MKIYEGTDGLRGLVRSLSRSMTLRKLCSRAIMRVLIPKMPPFSFG